MVFLAQYIGCMRLYFFLAIVLFFVSCATQNSDLEPAISEQSQDHQKPISDSVTCWDGTIKRAQTSCPHPPHAIAKICPDGRTISWPWDCRSAEEIRVENGQTTCAEQDMTFDLETNSCIP